jgi:glycosyltransferase involved in cell wall biosynthesis
LKKEIEEENQYVDHHIIYWSSTKLGKLKNLINIESKYNPFNRYANLISNTDVVKIKRKAISLKERGFNPDYIILEWTGMVLLATLMNKIFPQSKLIASEHDVTYIGYERKCKYYKGLKRLIWNIRLNNEKKLEIKSLSLCSIIFPHNYDNKEILISDGVLENKIKQLTPFYENMSDIKRSSNKRDLLFFGAMSREENYISAFWFIKKVMPLLDDMDVRFVVLGGNPPKLLKDAESDRVQVTGFVMDINPYFTESLCFVAPLLLGAGIKVKVLEAMSSGIPVLTNDIGIEGIKATSGKEYIFCKSEVEYALAIRKIFEDMNFGESIGESARKLVKEKFDIKMSLTNYKKLLVNDYHNN